MTSAANANLVLYSAKVCPWAQRVTLALQETGLEHSIYEIDLQNKPSFYNDKINPASKVPVLQIGGKDENDEGVPRIPESGVLLDLVGDLAKARGGRPLKPEDPIEMAEARYFVERYGQLVGPALGATLYAQKMEKIPDLMKSIEEFQKLLSARAEQTGGPFWHGTEPGHADLAIAPFLGRLKLFADRLEPYKSTDLSKVFNKDGQYKVFATYVEALVSRPSWSQTFDDDYILQNMKKRIESTNAAK